MATTLAQFKAKLGQNSFSHKQLNMLYQNYRIREQFQFHWNRAQDVGGIDRDAMYDAIAYDLNLPKTTIAGRVQQLKTAGVKFPVLKRKPRNSSACSIPVNIFNDMLTVEEEETETADA